MPDMASSSFSTSHCGSLRSGQFNGCDWSPRMIYHNPPKAVIGQAEVVTLLDPNVPGWKEVVVSRKAGLEVGPKDLDVINIPVDSTDPNVVQQWRDRISEARA